MDDTSRFRGRKVRLTEKQIIRMMRDQYDQHLRDVIKELSEKPADGMKADKSVEDPGDTKKDEKPKDQEPRVKVDNLGLDTRVTHLPNGGPRGYEYTVSHIGPDSVNLEYVNPDTGEVESLEVSKKDLEKEYVVD